MSRPANTRSPLRAPSAGTKLLVELTPTPMHAPHAGAAPENAAQEAPDSGTTAEPAWRSPLVAAGAGAAGVGVALGMILTVTANGRSSRVASLEAQPAAGGVLDARARASLEDARAAQRGFTHGAAGSFAAAGALALPTAALALWSVPARPAPAARALPVIGPSWGGLAVEGAF